MGAEDVLMIALRTGMEIAIGVLYAAGAVFNTAYTLGHGDKFYGAFVEGAWLRPSRWFLRSIVLPNATTFTLALILFEIVVAVLILTRGELVQAGLIAGAIFCAIAAIVSSPGGTIGNLALAAIQTGLALSR